MTTLDDLDLTDAPTTPEEWAEVTVTDDETLTRILRWLRSVERQRAAVRDLAQPELDRVEAWAAQMDAPLREKAARLEAAAVEYALSVRSRTGGKVKRIQTPNGTVATREAGGGWEKADEAATLAWALEARPELVKVADPTFDLAAAKRVLQAVDTADGGEVVDPASGAIVPGLKVRPKTVTGSVDLAAGGAA